jgi:RNA recognition motif-containing protein
LFSFSTVPPNDSNQIFITGLPKDMVKQVLFNTVWEEFSTYAGKIKVTKREFLRNDFNIKFLHFQIDGRTNKPRIDLLRQKDDRSKLSGAAFLTFEKKESAIAAINIYRRELDLIFTMMRRIQLAFMFQRSMC